MTNEEYLAELENKRIQDYITKHAMVSLGILKSMSDPDFEHYLERRYLFGMLIGILSNESDCSNARRTCVRVESMGYFIDENDLICRAREIRSKCKLELFVLSIAMDLLYSSKEDPSVVFAKVCHLLE